MSSSSSDENKKMNSMIRDDEIKAMREKLMLDFHKDVLTSRVGLSPILGNSGSQITGSAGNIGGRSSVERSMRSEGGLSVPCLTSRLNLNTNSRFGNLSVQGSKKLMAGMLQQGYSILMQQEIMALGIHVQPETLAVAVASEEARALEVVAVERLLNFFVEALCKVRGDIDVEFRDEANAADPYKVVVLVG
nr:transcription regulator NOT2/NOT3/NOT5-like protein [Tanacetum cinerariifolium]